MTSQHSHLGNSSRVALSAAAVRTTSALYGANDSMSLFSSGTGFGSSRQNKPVLPPAPHTGNKPVLPPAPHTGNKPVLPSAPHTGNKPVLPTAPHTGNKPVLPPAPHTGNNQCCHLYLTSKKCYPLNLERNSKIKQETVDMS